jgi:high-affinity iron transporter
VGWLPAIIDPLWNTAGYLPETSVPGQILQALLGYVSKPTLLQVATYAIYVIVVGVWLLRPVTKASPSAPALQPAAVGAEEVAAAHADQVRA